MEGQLSKDQGEEESTAGPDLSCKGIDFSKLEKIVYATDIGHETSEPC